jgi:hypothetical protein
VTCNAQQISCQAFGSRWASLRVGTMRTMSLRSLRERTDDRVLELHGDGEMLELPMRVWRYEILHRLLSKFAR